MNETIAVVVFQMDRTGPVHISEVISQLLPKYVGRPEPAAKKMQVPVGRLAETNRFRRGAKIEALIVVSLLVACCGLPLLLLRRASV